MFFQLARLRYCFRS